MPIWWPRSAELEEARARISSLEKLVDEDPLMPVCNRRAFVRELSRMMGLAGRYGLPGSVVYFDVNNLKQINDVHGHAAGDAALMQVARTLVESVRATDVVGRLGGDELGVLLLRTDKLLAEQKAGELAERRDQPFVGKAICTAWGEKFEKPHLWRRQVLEIPLHSSKWKPGFACQLVRQQPFSKALVVAQIGQLQHSQYDFASFIWAIAI